MEDAKRPHLRRSLSHDGSCPQRIYNANRRGVKTAKDDAFVDKGNPFFDFGGGEQLGRDAPRFGRGHAPGQFLQACFRTGDFDPTTFGEHAHLLVLRHAVKGQLRHLFGMINGKDEVGGMTGGSAGIGQRAFVDQNDVTPAQASQVVGHAVANNARADNHDICGFREFTHVFSFRVCGVGQCLMCRLSLSPVDECK